jgi:hypothetical protein
MTNPTGQLIADRVRIRARLLGRWTAHQIEAGSSSLDQGLAITPGEVAWLLLSPGEAQEVQRSWIAGDAEASALAREAAAADAALASDPAWSGLTNVFELTAAEADLLSLALAIDIDSRLTRVAAYLQDDARAIHPTAALSAALFGVGGAPRGVQPLGLLDALARWRLLHPVEPAAAWSPALSWRADPAALLSVLEGRWRDPRLEGVVTTIEPDAARRFPCAHPRALTALLAFEGCGELAITGPAGSGRQTLAAQLAAARGRALLAIDAKALLAGPAPPLEALVAAHRMAKATGSLTYWRDAEEIAASDWSRSKGLAPLRLRGDRVAPAGADLSVALGRLPLERRRKIWSFHSAAPPPAALTTHQLSVHEIARAARASASDDPEAISAALRAPLPVHGDLLHLLPCPYEWDDLVVPPELQRQLREFEAQARLRWEVYESWGFERLTHLGAGISALFGGPSGTGKTMAAQVLARALGLDLYRVDLAGVVNKYIGETEKRLRDVFDACERAGTLLFFDEADALFGARTQVRDAHDRFANIEINYLLQRIERFEGIAILATNRKNDLDSAFMRRLRFVIDFLAPAAAEREALWRRALLPTAPDGAPLLDEIDFGFLAAKLEMTGAQIKSTALGAAFLARVEGQRISMRHVLAAAQREMAKHGGLPRIAVREAAR